MDKVVVYNVGLYCRLSLDDGNVGESESIQTQKINRKRRASLCITDCVARLSIFD